MELAAVMCSDGQIEADDITFRAANAVSDFLLEEMTLKDYTNRIIKTFLKRYDNNVLKVADKLDIGKSTIYRLLQEEKESSIDS